MSTIADLVIKVSADTGVAEKDINSFGSKVGGGFKKALVPATAALALMGVAGKAAFNNLQDGAKNARQTEQVIKTTGGAANVTAKHVDDLAMSIRRKAGVDDDAVHSGENMLLTFTNIRNEVGKGNQIFDRATATVMDMSVALGQDTKSSAIQLGKALNDPVKGVTALQRVGVSFTAQQKEQIKTLVASGHTLDAQKLILRELNKEFGGASTHIDPMQRSIANLKLDMTDLASSILSAAMPALKAMIGAVAGVTSWLTQHQSVAKIVIGVLLGLIAVVYAVNAAMKVYAAGTIIAKVAVKAFEAAQWLMNAALAANPIFLVIAALVALGVALYIAWTKSETFRNIVTGAWNAIKSVTMTVFNAIIDFFRRFWPVLLALALPGLGLLIALVITKWDTIRSVTVAIWNGIKAVIGGVISAIRAVVSAGFNALVGVVSATLNAVRSTVSAIWNGIKTVVSAAVDGVKSAVRAGFGALGGIIQAAAGAVRAGVGGIKSVLNGIVSVLQAIVRAAEAAGNAISAVVHAAGKITSLPGKLKGGGVPFVPGFASGVRNFSGGPAVVGENGPELVNLPRGSSVFSNSDSRSLLGGRDAPIIGEVHVHDDVDVEVLARRVQRIMAFG